MNNIIAEIKSYISKHNLIPNGSKIVLGLSGGPDSVFLLEFLLILKKENVIQEIFCAHLDHEWRLESQQDANFCLKIAKRQDLPIIIQKLSKLGIESKFNGSKEELGRHARRHFLESVRKNFNADLITLAHHAQDQQETFLIRLIRGSSLSGLISMKPRYSFYIRPLLEINKKDIVNYLKKNNIPSLIDPSNILETFLRNKIRKKVIPALQECDPRFDRNFKETLRRLSESENFLEKLTVKEFDNISSQEKDIFYINIKQLFHLSSVLHYRIILYWLKQQNVKFPVSESFFNEMLKFLKQPESKEHQLHHDWHLVKKKDLAYIKKIG